MRLKKRTLVLLGVMVVAIAASIGAYAYFTTTGAGDGTATVGTDTALLISGTSSANFYPGGPAVPVTLTVKNNSPGHEFVTNVTLTGVDAYASAANRTAGTPNINGTGAGQCDVSQFSQSPVAQAENQDVPGGGAVTTLTNASSVSMANETLVDQSGCKNAFLALHYTSN